jgi:hypothetical protein
MEMTLLTGSTNPLLAQATAERLGVRACKRDLHRFPDGDQHVEIRESVRGHHVYLIQPTSPPAEGQLFELLMLADAARQGARQRLHWTSRRYAGTDPQPPSGWSWEFTAWCRRGRWAMLDALERRLFRSWSILISRKLDMCHGGSLPL